MAEVKTKVVEREYVIPLRSQWMKVPRYKRTAKSVKAIKEFIAKHMKVTDRNLDNVRLDVYLNNEVWFRGRQTPPTKVKVIAKKEGEIVRVELADVPEYVKFLKARHEKANKKADKKAPKTEEKKEEEPKVEEEKKEEQQEKAKSLETMQDKIADQKAHAQKHTSKDKKVVTHRMAMQK